MFADMGMELDGSSAWVFKNYQLALPLMLAVLAMTIISIWWRYRMHSLVVAFGIVWLSIGSHVIVSAATTPLLKMIQEVDDY